jgi:hypothetical protein
MTSNNNSDESQSKKKASSLFSTSCGASVLMALYIGMASFNIYQLMFPLATVDLTSFPPSSYVNPLWSKASEIHLKLYLSSRKDFEASFVHEAEFAGEDDDSNATLTDTVALLMSEKLDSPAFSKSFILTTCQDGDNSCQQDESYSAAVSLLDQAEHVAAESSEGGLFSAMAAAGNGIESTSFLLMFYNSMTSQLQSLLVLLSIVPEDIKGETTDANAHKETRKIVYLPRNSQIWSSLSSNSTLYVHALLVRTDQGFSWPPTTRNQVDQTLRRALNSHSLLLGDVNMVKYDRPHHIGKPGRVLFHDLVYLFEKYILGSSTASPPWNMASSKPQDFANYETMMEMKRTGSAYPYWKPEVAIKLVNEEDAYPSELAGLSRMPVIRLTHSEQHPTGRAFTPALHIDEIGLTSEKYIPINETLSTLPLRISFDRSDIPHTMQQTTATAGGMSPARWRLLTHLSQSLEAQKQLGFEQQDIDDVRRLIADTNVTLLAITILFSALHMLFEFLTFKSEVSFWKNNKDLTGLSVRSLFLDMIGQTVILLFLIERESSLLMTIPSGIGCLIALWKCRRAAGLEFVKIQGGRRVAWWNWFPSLFGYELRATRLEAFSQNDDANTIDKEKKGGQPRQKNLAQVTIEADRIATRTLGSVLLPLVMGYALYSFLREEHTGWYSWLVTSASSAVYALGFVLMTPQLFLNWKLKSVAHLPWLVLVYKSLNTFIDDLFSFIIRMPTMARISCFRDDIVFFIYLYQRWLYPVDTSRPVEGGVGEADNAAAKAVEKKKQ